MHQTENGVRTLKTIYADVLFCINFFIDFALLSSAAFILKRKIGGLRLTISAALGAVYSVLIFIPELSLLASLGIKLVFSGVMTLTAFGWRSSLGFLKSYAVFYGVSSVFGGAVFGVFCLLRPSAMVIKNSSVYIDIKPFYLFLLIGAVYAAVRIFYFFLPRKNEEYIKITILLGGKTQTLTALYDSGNLLTDVMSGAPVVIAEFTKLERLIPRPLRRTFRNPMQPCSEMSAWGHSFRLIPAHGAFGKDTLLPAFRPDGMIIERGGREGSVDNVFVALTDRMLSSDGRYSALIGDELTQNTRFSKEGAA